MILVCHIFLYYCLSYHLLLVKKFYKNRPTTIFDVSEYIWILSFEKYFYQYSIKPFYLELYMTIFCYTPYPYGKLFLKLNIKSPSLHGKGFTENAFSANSITSTYCIVTLSELIARSRKTDIQTDSINFNKILFYTNPSLFKSKGNQLCKKEWNRYVNLSGEDARTFC